MSPPYPFSPWYPFCPFVPFPLSLPTYHQAAALLFPNIWSSAQQSRQLGHSSQAPGQQKTQQLDISSSKVLPVLPSPTSSKCILVGHVSPPQSAPYAYSHLYASHGNSGQAQTPSIYQVFQRSPEKDDTATNNVCRHVAPVEENVETTSGTNGKTTMLMSLDEELFACDADGCIYQTIDPKSLARHKRSRMHTVPRMYECTWPDCSFQHRLLRHVKRHMASHTGSKAFKCRFCEKSYGHRASRIAHTKKHHGDMRSDPPKIMYTCDVPSCSFKSDKHSILTKHMSTHLLTDMRFACVWKDCQFRTNKEDELAIHKVIHTAEISYRCTWEYCSFSAARSGDLKRHMSVHLGGILHQCQKCGKTFKKQGPLQNHLKRVHN